MRRSASEVINNLETRIARLEKQSGFFDFFTGGLSIKDVVRIIDESHREAKVSLESPDKIIFSFTLGDVDYWFKGHIVRNKKKVRASALSSISIFNKLMGGSSQGVKLTDPDLLVVEFTPDFRKMGLKETKTSLGALNVYIDSYDKELVKSEFKDSLKFKPMIKELNALRAKRSHF